MGQEPFFDYYEILQLSQKADQETIERVYRLLAKRYHPDNHNTGDSEKFAELTRAYRVLSDPEKRAGYDAKYEAGISYQWNILSHGSPLEKSEEDRRIYQAVLSMLYTARRRDVGHPGVGIFQIEKLLGVPEKYLEFHIWYLREKGWIQRVENGGFAITVEGVEAITENEVPLKKERLLSAGDEFGSATDHLKSQDQRMISNQTDHTMS